jgi:uracil-DNA glycosylase family 4
MGFFLLDKKPDNSPLRGLPVDFLRRHECQACPLNHEPGLRHPKMEAYGCENPLVYFLGEAPGEDEDRQGKPFVGKAGKVLRFRIPKDWEPHIRWSNSIHCRPPKNRDPTEVELECCRPRNVRDIEKTKPKAIFGFGNIALRWALNQSLITVWNGRRVPIKIGNHACWFFPMLHPSFVGRSRKFNPRNQNEYGSDLEFVFAQDLKWAFKQIESLPEPVVHTQADIHKNCEFVTGSGGEFDVERVLKFLEWLHGHPSTGLDYETNCYRPYAANAKILTVALSGSDGHTLSFPLRHKQAGWTPQQLNRVEEVLQLFLYNYKGRRIAHNLAFEQEWSGFFFGKEVLHAGRWEDTMAQAFILDMGGRGKDEDKEKGGPSGGLKLDFLCLQYFGIQIKPHDLDLNNLDDEPLEKVLRYNGPDAKYARSLYLSQSKRLVEEGLSDVYNHHVRRIAAMVLTQMKGLPIDDVANERLAEKYGGEIERIEKEITGHPDFQKFRRRIGKDYRPSAPQDAMRFCRDILGRIIEKSDETVLSKIKHPVIQNTLDYRKVAKQLSTYVKPVAKENRYPDGLVHFVLNTCKVRSWRTSSDGPNVQNWTKHGELVLSNGTKWLNNEVRCQVAAPPGYKIVAFDYAGIQARNVAMESKDPALVKAFWEKYDIHTDWMEQIAELCPEWIVEGIKALKDKEVRKFYRQRSKNEFVFATFFGAQPKKVSDTLGIPIDKAEILHERFLYERFPELGAWQKRLKTDYYKNGYVTGLSGFRRRAPVSINQLINYPIQADEAIIVCDAMARLAEMGPDAYHANMEVHDDLTFIWPTKKIDEYAEVVIDTMLSSPFDWINVPLGVEMSVGDHWDMLEKPEGKAGEYFSNEWNRVL